jgi:molybdopterin molybdotransferase
MQISLKMGTPFCGDDHDATAMDFQVARQAILNLVSARGLNEQERLPLWDALDRVLAEEVVANRNVPAFNNSAMDGYALSGIDIPRQGIAELKVIGKSFAGHPFLGVCAQGECIKIMTGAMVPESCDTVIPQENIEIVDEGHIRIDGRTRQGENVRMAGEDIAYGQSVLTPGRRITAADLGLLASLGLRHVNVIRRLRIAFCTTGDELQTVGEELKSGQIYDSNRYTLFGLLKHQYCEITDLGVIADDVMKLRDALQSAAKQFDVIISSGGVSVGEADYVRQVLGELGEVAFWKVAMKPGRPLTFGRINQAWFFGLPGNPVAVMVSFCQFVRPALQRLSGEAVSQPLILQAISESVLRKRAGRTEFQRGVLRQEADGRLVVSKTGEQGSGMLLSMSRGNCFIVMSAGQTRVEVGAYVNVQPFSNWV